MRFAETYSVKSDEELDHLAKEKDSLRPEAVAALAMELRRRRTSPGAQASYQQDSRSSAIDAAPDGSLIVALVFFTL
jgi:hypothetical protein